MAMALVTLLILAMRVGRVWILLAHALGGGHHGAKQEMLHDGELAEDLGDKHAAHAAVNLGPRLGGGDVVEHGAVPAQALDRLGAVDKVDLAEVEVIVPGLLERQVLVDGARGDVGVVEELGGAEQERQELVVVEAPDAVGAGGLEVVEHLHGAHELQVAVKDAQHERLEVGGVDDAQPVQAQQPDGKVELVAGAVVDAVAVAKGLGKVGGGLGHGGRGAFVSAAVEPELPVPAVGALAHQVEEAPKGLVAEARAPLLVGRRDLGERLGFFEDCQQRFNGVAKVGILRGRRGAGRIDDGVGEPKHPADNGAVRRRRQEELVVFAGEDSARGHFKGPLRDIVERHRHGGRRGDGRRVRGWRASLAGFELGEAVFEVRY